MRWSALMTSLQVLLLGSALSRAKAERIVIAEESNSPEMLMDISMRDMN